MIFTGDDFGRSREINAAIERAHREGILTTASLMVGEPAVRDAVERARRLPGLHVGLHLTLVNGRAVLPPSEIPLLVDATGQFGRDEVRVAVRYFVTPRIRAQLLAEIRAQFAAFAVTGLRLDHVNAHQHLHVHPTIFSLLLQVGRENGSPPVRIPLEPTAPWWLRPWLGLMVRRARAAGVVSNRWVGTLPRGCPSGPAYLLSSLRTLPPGITELYFHPGAAEQDLAALIDPAVVAFVCNGGVATATFSELAPPR